MSWTPTSLPKRPGAYTRFQDEIERVIQGGARGVVAIPLLSYDGTAIEKNFYTVERVTEANELFGSANIGSIRNILDAGANRVLVYTMPTTPVDDEYDEMLDAFATQHFNVFVLDEEDDASLQAMVLAAVEVWKDEDKHVLVVFGGSASDDATIEAGNARSNTLGNDYAVNLGTGVTWLGDNYSSAEYAPYIAGLIAGTPLNQSITYKQVRADDVTKRLKNSEIEAAIDAGTLVLIHDGQRVKIEKGITTTGEHIRSIVARQTILNDIPSFLKSEVVAQIDNSEDGRASVVSMIKRYLETLANEGVISGDEGEEPNVYVDPDNPPQQDAAFFVIEYTDQYSMERIFLTVKRQG